MLGRQSPGYDPDVRTIRRPVSLTDILVSLPEQSQIYASSMAVAEMGRRDCFEPAANQYALSLRPSARKTTIKPNSERFFLHLLNSGYTDDDAREILKGHSLLTYPATYGLENAMMSCMGGANGRDVFARILNDEWARIWRANPTKANAVPLLQATLRTGEHVFAPGDIGYVAVRLASSVLEGVTGSRNIGISERALSALVSDALYLTRGRSISDPASAAATAGAVLRQVTQYIYAASDMDYELDERMRELVADGDDLNDDRDDDADVALDYEMLGVARLPFITVGLGLGRGHSLAYGTAGPVIVDEDNGEEWAIYLAAAAAAIVVSWHVRDSRYELEFSMLGALEAAVAAATVADDTIRVRRLRDGAADRYYDPTEAAILALKIWHRAFPAPWFVDFPPLKR